MTIVAPGSLLDKLSEVDLNTENNSNNPYSFISTDLGDISDTPATDYTSPHSLIALTKAILEKETGLWSAVATDYQLERNVLLAGGSYVKDGYQRYGTLPLSDTGNEVKTLATSTGKVTSSGNLTRPNDTIAYSAGDVAHGVFEITGLGSANQLVQINRAVLKIQVASIPSGMTTFKLIAHSSTPSSAIADNGVYTPTGDGIIYQLTAQSEPVVDKGDWLQAEFISFDGNGFAKLSSGGSLFCYLITDGGFTPTALAVKTIDLYSVGF